MLAVIAYSIPPSSWIVGRAAIAANRARFLCVLIETLQSVTYVPVLFNYLSPRPVSQSSHCELLSLRGGCLRAQGSLQRFAARMRFSRSARSSSAWIASFSALFGSGSSVIHGNRYTATWLPTRDFDIFLSCCARSDFRPAIARLRSGHSSEKAGSFRSPGCSRSSGTN